MRTLALLALVLAVVAAAPPAQRDRVADELENFTLRQFEFAAPSLESLWGEAGVYLPSGYDYEANAHRSYPCVIWLHGMNGDASRFQRNGAALLDRLRGEGAIPEMVFVAVTAGRRSVYFNGERSGDYEDLIVYDLPAALEKEFRVSTSRSQWAIMGISIGGFGAMRFAFKHPGKFGTVAAHSSAVFPADPSKLSQRYLRQAQSMGLTETLGDPIDRDVWDREIPTAMLTRLTPADLKGLRIYFDAGTNDRYGFAGPNTKLHELLQQRGIEHTYRLIEGGGHSWGSGFTQQALQTSLLFVGNGFATAGDGGRAGPHKKKRRAG